MSFPCKKSLLLCVAISAFSRLSFSADIAGLQNVDDSRQPARAYFGWGETEYTDGDFYVDTWPDWVIHAWRAGGDWLAQPPCWRVSGNTPYNYGSLLVMIDRAALTGKNLRYAVVYHDYPGASLHMDLLDAYGFAVAVDITGNLITGSDEKVIAVLNVPLTDWPDAEVISLRRGMGEICVFECMLLTADDELFTLDPMPDVSVGIGTTSPNGALDVDGSLYVGTQGIYDRDDGTVDVMEDMRVHGGNFLLGTDNTKIYRHAAGEIRTPGNFLVDGRVGIGTTSPGYTLDVNGSAWIHESVFANRVGAGTVLPGLSLDVVGLARIGSQDVAGYGTLRVKTRSDAGGYTAWFEAIDSRRALGIVAGTSYHLIQSDWSGTVGPAPIAFRIAGSAPGQIQLGITQTGVGVNTLSPQHPLDVNGNAHIRGDLFISSGDCRIKALTGLPGMAPVLALCSTQAGTYKTVVVPPMGGVMVTKSDNLDYVIHTKDDGSLIVKWKVFEGSDSRAKMEQAPLTYGLAEIMALQPKQYRLRDWTIDQESGEIQFESTSVMNDIGLVAQEVYHVIPEAARPPEDETKDIWTLSYSKITPVLVKAVQEQQKQIEKQQQQIDTLMAELEALKSRIQ